MNCPFQVGQLVRQNRPGWSGDDIMEVTAIGEDEIHLKLIDSCDPNAMRWTGAITIYKTGWKNLAESNCIQFIETEDTAA